jgi:hypothetical protein
MGCSLIGVSEKESELAVSARMSCGAAGAAILVAFTQTEALVAAT